MIVSLVWCAYFVPQKVSGCFEIVIRNRHRWTWWYLAPLFHHESGTWSKSTRLDCNRQQWVFAVETHEQSRYYNAWGKRSRQLFDKYVSQKLPEHKSYVYKHYQIIYVISGLFEGNGIIDNELSRWYLDTFSLKFGSANYLKLRSVWVCGQSSGSK